ncbi:Spo0E family sporulation regulatory protein-aspartic acid phosphatase [Desulforamulus reducens]|uniref:Spo0E family sporulation regulatory protein-aspartic acid phosphatase n=1 Tax=Desulforamulus reducens TaxID=59610 RepID=UPI003B75CCE4
MFEIEKLLSKIEFLRYELKRVARNKHFTDPEVIAASERLDRVLTQYYRLRDMRFLNKTEVG